LESFQTWKREGETTPETTAMKGALQNLSKIPIKTLGDLCPRDMHTYIHTKPSFFVLSLLLL